MYDIDDSKFGCWNSEIERGIHKIESLSFNSQYRDVQDIRNKVNEIIGVINALIDAI